MAGQMAGEIHIIKSKAAQLAATPLRSLGATAGPQQTFRGFWRLSRLREGKQ
jgi:hypothetical protein